jgi:hypothetical protein
MGGVVSFESFECGRCTLPQRECEPDVRDVASFPKFREVNEVQMPNGVQETVRMIMTERPDIQETLSAMMNEGVPLSLRPDVQVAIAQVMTNEGVPLRPDIQESVCTLINGRVPIPLECQMMNEGRPLHPFMNSIITNSVSNDECVKTKRNKRRRRQRKPRCRGQRVNTCANEGNEIVFKDEESRDQFIELMTKHEGDPFTSS